MNGSVIVQNLDRDSIILPIGLVFTVYIVDCFSALCVPIRLSFRHFNRGYSTCKYNYKRKYMGITVAYKCEYFDNHVLVLVVVLTEHKKSP